MIKINLNKPIPMEYSNDQLYYVNSNGVGIMLSTFLNSRYGKKKIEEIMKINSPTINLLELVEDFDTGLLYYKYGLDSKELDKAKKIFLESYKSDKKILIVTDYDCDGINSAVVSQKLIDKFLDKDKFTVIVNKREYGNGVNKENFKNINLNDYSLLITADHGSSNNTLFLYLKDEYPDMKIIVTDHHIIPEDMPPVNADCVLNNMSDEHFNHNLSGCYTIWYFFFYILVKEFKKKQIDVLYEVVDNLALTVISDVMNVDEPLNRMIYKLAIEKINKGDSDFFNNLRKHMNLPELISLDDFRFNVCPIINSGNRLHKEEVAFEALYNPKSDALSDLIELNNKRKKLTNLTLERLEDNNAIYLNSVCISTIRTNYGINGIIAGKLGEKYRRPSICFARDDKDILHGSCRSIIPGLNMLEVIKELHRRGLVDKFGGHSMAVGCMIRAKEYQDFVSECDLIVKNELGKLKDTDSIEIDGVINIDDISDFDIFGLDYYEPFGNGFEDPMFYTEITVDSSYVTDTIARIKVLNSYRFIDFMAFNNIKAPLKEVFKNGNRLGIIFTPSVSNYRNKLSVNLLIKRAVVL